MTLSRITQRFEGLNRPGVDRAGRVAPGAEGMESTRAVMVQDGFAQDRAGGIARAQEQHAHRSLRHRCSQQQEELACASCGSQQAPDAALEEASRRSEEHTSELQSLM